MVVLRNNQITMWEQILPKELLALPEELQRIDELLDDEKLFEPYLERFNARMSRPTVKVETNIRIMYFLFSPLNALDIESLNQ